MACNKEGVGGKASVIGQVMNQGEIIPDAVVYIKYGANNFPGFDPELYDDVRAVGTANASFSFTNLYKGSYYLYAAGFDSTIMESVSGGVGIVLEKKRENRNVDILVSE